MRRTEKELALRGNVNITKEDCETIRRELVMHLNNPYTRYKSINPSNCHNLGKTVSDAEVFCTKAARDLISIIKSSVSLAYGFPLELRLSRKELIALRFCANHGKTTLSDYMHGADIESFILPAKVVSLTVEQKLAAAELALKEKTDELRTANEALRRAKIVASDNKAALGRRSERIRELSAQLANARSFVEFDDLERAHSNLRAGIEQLLEE